MPLLDITPGQMDIQLSRTLGGMSQNLLQYGGGATGFDPERSGGVAEEVGGDFGLGTKERKSRTSEGEIQLSPLNRYEKPTI